MTRLFLLIIPIFINLTGWAQEVNQERADYIKLKWDSNFPDELYTFYNQEKIKNIYEINKDLNPLYLRGDFDGDKKIDYVLAIIETKTQKKGILIYHTEKKKHFVAGAGSSITNGHGDDYQWMDAWEVSDEKRIEQGVGGPQKIKLRGEAIQLQKLESSSGLVYWDGKEYSWYQQGD